MTTKLLGIGIVCAGCLAGVAGAGYLAVHQDPGTIPVPTPIVVEAQPIAQVPAQPDPAPAAPIEPDRQSDPKPERLVRATRTTPAQAAPRTVPRPEPKPEVTPPAVVAPVVAQTPPPPDPPTPVVAEPPRYVPEPAVPVATDVQESPRVQYDELTIEKRSVIGIRLDQALSTRTARLEDRVSATVSRDVTVSGRTAIAAGARLEGTVVLVERGGRFKDRPRLGLRFDRMILTDGTRVSLQTDTIYREGDSPSADATAKVGAGAVAGAILGAVLGGKKGAAIGGAAGVAGGTAAVLKGDGNEASIPAGAPLTVRLTEDVTVTIQR